ncbi:MAG: porin [Gammaproteobacteria bacterium]
MKRTPFLAALPILLLASAGTLADGAPATPTIEQLWDIIQAQQAEIDALKQKQAATAATATAADEKAEAAVVAVEESTTHTASAGSWAEHTTIGGYGEMHYNNIDADDSSRDQKEIDFHRFVLFFGHEFTDDLRFFSELEIEHALTKDNVCDFTVPPGGLAPGDEICDGASNPGEVEVEQAYIEFDINDQLSTKGGIFILPVGIMNETHEPNTFYGVERNDVENIIIPATWWAGGAAISGHHANGLSWDLAIHEGLKIPTTGGSAFRVRSGRQKTSEAVADKLAYTGRVRYTGIPGLEVGASVNYQTDPSQSGGDGLDNGILYETHVAYQNGPFALRALYAEWDFDGTAVNVAKADDQSGWYVEPSFKPRDDVGFYARYEDIDAARSRDKFDQWEIGVNFWPHEDVVLKADYRSRDHDLAVESGRDFDAFDLGIGYQF